MKRKEKKGEGTKVETERGRRELTIFFRVKKDIPLGLIDIMIGGGGRRGGV